MEVCAGFSPCAPWWQFYLLSSCQKPSVQLVELRAHPGVGAAAAVEGAHFDLWPPEWSGLLVPMATLESSRSPSWASLLPHSVQGKCCAEWLQQRGASCATWYLRTALPSPPLPHAVSCWTPAQLFFCVPQHKQRRGGFLFPSAVLHWSMATCALLLMWG